MPDKVIAGDTAEDGNLPCFEDHANQQIKHTTCYMCACRCGIKVTLENNKIRFIQGTREHPVNRGVLCAKGNAGIMKQSSPAKLKKPMLRKATADRGRGEFEEISWQKALDILVERLDKIRKSDPKKLAYFTGRDQMQALTGLWAQQFGTVNWAAHGGFCSVNMAAGGLYTMGYSFWEFGEPDWDRTKYFMLWGVAEDHASNPIKIGLEKLKRRGSKFVAVNPVRTGYQAIADEWVPVIPGSDAMLALSMVHVLLKNELFDWEFLVRYTNAPYLLIDNPGGSDDGLVYRNTEGKPYIWDLKTESIAAAALCGTQPALFGEYRSKEGIKLKTVFTTLTEQYLDEKYAPEHAAAVCGINADTIERLALEMAHIAFKETIEVPCQWVDSAGRQHDSFIGRPVSMHAMRGISAHSNGFQTCRAIHLLQILLGAIDCPGAYRAKPPYPKHIPPSIKPAQHSKAGEALPAPPLGFPTCPEDLVIDDKGQPLRIDKAYSWEAPLANHGLMHTVITNAANGDPYPIDTLMLFMANMSWNSTMNVAKIQNMLKAKDAGGEYKIPFLVVIDAFNSEMVQFADLVLPDTTYLERYDTISLLDRPISDPDAVCDSIRAPVLEPDRDAKPWQEVMIELASRLKFPAFLNEDGGAKYKDYKDFIVNFQKAPGIGFLAGWRGADGSKHLRGEPNPKQWEKYIENKCFLHYELPEHMRFYRFANKDYLEFAKGVGFNESSEPVVIELYSETLQKFRLAAMGVYNGPQPPQQKDRERIKTFCSPLPSHYTPLEQTPQVHDSRDYPFYAITQRPMMMYHSWDSQNPWLRQIIAKNFLYMNRKRAERMGIEDLSWVWVESRNAKIRVQIKLMEGIQEDTVWTWNAIGKARGTWGLSEDANEANEGFLLNHLIDELLPKDLYDRPVANADPVTGQAAWYDLCVKISPANGSNDGVQPLYEPRIKAVQQDADATLRYQSHKAVHLKRSFKDIITRGLK